jgi:hypothetical protein
MLEVRNDFRPELENKFSLRLLGRLRYRYNNSVEHI